MGGLVSMLEQDGARRLQAGMLLQHNDVDNPLWSLSISRQLHQLLGARARVQPPLQLQLLRGLQGLWAQNSPRLGWDQLGWDQLGWDNLGCYRQLTLVCGETCGVYELLRAL